MVTPNGRVCGNGRCHVMTSISSSKTKIYSPEKNFSGDTLTVYIPSGVIIP